MNTYFISDTHFWDSQIIEYESRPFINAMDMNNVLINNWNSVVKDDDNVFMLGDFSVESKDVSYMLSCLRVLNGRKHLIMGNHDRFLSPDEWRRFGFAEVSEYPIIYNSFFILSHEPLYVNKKMPYVNIHGHLHGRNMSGWKHFNVSVENILYKPISYDDIMRKLG